MTGVSDLSRLLQLSGQVRPNPLASRSDWHRNGTASHSLPCRIARSCGSPSGYKRILVPVSYHLRELREAGLVVAAAHGRSNRYRLAHAHLDQLATLLGNLEPESQTFT